MGKHASRDSTVGVLPVVLVALVIAGLVAMLNPFW